MGSMWSRFAGRALAGMRRHFSLPLYFPQGLTNDQIEKRSGYDHKLSDIHIGIAPKSKIVRWQTRRVTCEEIANVVSDDFVKVWRNQRTERQKVNWDLNSVRQSTTLFSHSTAE
jgi:hypothetical protein